jgi:hypothetical protein
MSQDLEQLFREPSAPAPATRIDLDTVVRRGRSARRRHQVRTTATVGVTGALVVGIGALAASGQVTTGSGPAAGGGTAPGPVTTTLAATADSPVPTPSASGAGDATVPPVPTPSSSGAVDVTTSPFPTPGSSGGTASAVATPTATAYPPAPTPVSSEAPAALRAVTLPDPAPRFGGRRFPDAVELTNDFNALPGPFWTATFGVGDATGVGRQATVFVGEFPMPPTSGTPTLGSSPGPITDTPTVAGHQAYVTHDGTQTILYFRAARFTVQVCGWHASVDDLVTLAEALRGIE